MPSNFTENYQLSQWEATDRVQRTDFNADNAKIDGAIKAEADARAAGDAALQTLINGKGNCRIEVGSYQGDGVNNRLITITASFQPKVILLAGSFSACLIQGASFYSVSFGGQRFAPSLTWSGNSVSWRAIYTDQSVCFNNQDTIYYVVLG